MAPSSDLQAKLAEIQLDYSRQLPDRCRQLQESWQKVESAHWQTQDLLALRMQLHKLAGSGAMFGYQRMSRHSRALEVLIDNLLAQPEALNKEVEEQCAEQLKLILDASHDTPDERKEVGRSQPEPSCETLYLITTEQPLAHQLKVQFGHFGQRFVHLCDSSELAERVAQEPALAVLVDLDQLESVAAIEALGDAPLLTLSPRDDFASRLNAAALGARAYLTLPLELHQLFDRLDSLSKHYDRRPYRVVVICANPVLGAFYQQLIASEEIELRLVHTAADSLELLSDFQPELILLDTQLPDTSGSLLGEVIRQHDNFIGIPILFLANAQEAGNPPHHDYHLGDKLLFKPLQADLLVRALLHRVERARLVRSQLRHDGLTGLLNHSATSEAVSVEINRSNRHQASFAYIMLDLDHFKKVNDYHGHAAGDQVLRNLARLLRQRLRGSDLIGRYGGEEFVIGLDNSDAEVAAQVINELRRDFAALLQQSEPHDFHVTFSAGVALYPEFGDLAALTSAADKALYAAKHAGRNRVMIAHLDSQPSDITRTS